MKFGIILAGAALSAIMIPAVLAETMTYKADLKASEEVPATASKGSGTATVTFDPATKVLTWKVTYSGLTGPATMGHFHGPAAPGQNAGVAIPFEKVDSPIEGSAKLTDQQIADLKAGQLYINIHTAANKPGEIRGQVTAAK
jgi:CHRD domain-containing protein